MHQPADNVTQQSPQWVLVFPRYSGSLRAWRFDRGQGLHQKDTQLYLGIFLQVWLYVLQCSLYIVRLLQQ